jgi:hypothetical protein
VHELDAKVPEEEELQVTRPAAWVPARVVSVTLAVQVVDTPTVAGFGEHATPVAVVSPLLTVTAPVAVLIRNAPPLQSVLPGMQSLTFELVEALARVWP